MDGQARSVADLQTLSLQIQPTANRSQDNQDGDAPESRKLLARHNAIRRNRRALLITETELKLIAAAAMIGDNSKPKTG